MAAAVAKEKAEEKARIAKVAAERAKEALYAVASLKSRLGDRMRSLETSNGSRGRCGPEKSLVRSRKSGAGGRKLRKG